MRESVKSLHPEPTTIHTHSLLHICNSYVVERLVQVETDYTYGQMDVGVYIQGSLFHIQTQTQWNLISRA
jgi:hypothetical protein